MAYRLKPDSLRAGASRIILNPIAAQSKIQAEAQKQKARQARKRMAKGVTSAMDRKVYGALFLVLLAILG